MVSARTLWTSMPVPVREGLMLSAHGDLRMYTLFSLIMQRMEQEWPGLTSQDKCDLLYGLAVTIWADAPWDARACSLVAQCANSGMEVPRPLLRVAKNGMVSDGEYAAMTERLDDAVENGDMAHVRSLLLTLRNTQPTLLFLLEYANRVSLLLGDVDWFREFYDGMKVPPLLRCMLDGMASFAEEAWEAAAQSYMQAISLCPLPGLHARLGECLYRCGDAGALPLLSRASQESPWDSGLLLRVADMRDGLDRPAPLPAGQGTILLYSWNHAADLEDTLTHVLASELGSAKVLLLDNGSTDETPAVAARMRGRFAGRLRCFRLPVNVGAPAARNWLLQEPEAQEADWVVFLDDDALVPPDWLGHMGTALTAFPDAAIVGCQVSPVQGNIAVQSVDLHLHCDALTRAGKAVLYLDDMVTYTQDFGSFKYIRPCLHVTGCCHLLRRESLARVGGFDIMFSPSQYDDLERDIRAALDGQRIVYTGHLRVRHKKRTGCMTRINQRQAISGSGNFAKLRALLTQEQLHALRRADYAAVFEHLLRRILHVGSG